MLKNGAAPPPAPSGQQPVDRQPVAGMPGFAEFVLIASGLMGLTALSIDIMLPALGQIRDDYGLGSSNNQQFVITAFLLGFAFGQLFYGPLSDRFGRKGLLLFGLGFFMVSSLICMFTQSFEVLLGARFLQGVATAAPRILALATVRDIYEGRRMAEVMSFVMMVFVVLPILAPLFGAGIMMLADWHMIFGFLTLFSMLVFVWVAWRLPETNPPERRMPLSASAVLGAVRTILNTRQTLGYALTMGVMLSSLFAYITLAQQVFTEVYGEGDRFPLLFAIVAASLIVSFFTNGRLVMRLGMRRISHLAILGFIATALLHLALHVVLGPLSLWLFVGILTLNLYFYGLTMPNFNAIAMSPMGKIAGTASSFIGAVTTGISALLSGAISQFYAGTAMPLLLGFALCGLIALALALITEKGRLFHGAD